MALDPELAANLRDNFLVTLRRNATLKAQFLTDGLYDLEKLFGLYEAAGLERPRVPIIAREDAATEQHILEDSQTRAWKQPDPNDHYVFAIGQQRLPPWRAARLSSVRLSYDITRPGQPEFYFFTAAGEAINSLFFGGNPFLEDPVLSIEEPCVFADDFFVNFNICHLLYDKLPRAVTGSKMGAKSALFFRTPPYVSALCGLFDVTAIGVPPRVRRGTIALKECLCFTDSFHQLMHPGRFGGATHMAALDHVKDQIQAALGPLENGPKRYFIQRNPEQPRAIVNDEAVTALLHKHGFTLGDPGSLPPLEQMQLFLSVTHLGGVHGAGLANLAFQAPGSHVMELLPPLCATGAYWRMSSSRSLHYHHLVCEDPELGAVDAKAQRHDVRYNRRNVVVPIDPFTALLEQLSCA